MKRFTFLKAFMLSCFMAAVSLLPMSLNAQQTSDDFFRTNDFGGSRSVAEWSIVNNGIGQSETPLGSGLLVLTAVGAGYAIARRKRNIKKGTTLLLAALMLLGMTNCRKNLETINSVPSNGVYITLDLNGGSKVIVNPTGHTDPNYATVTWEDGDILYVGNNGAYCGYLEYDGTKFGGTINPTSGDDADYLHFYFMGNKGTTSEPTSVNITDQTSKYPVISYGRSTDLYNSGTTSYSATLYNKCAIRKFNTTEIDKAITITGMNNTVTVNFAANKGATTGEPYSFSKSGDGEIKLHAESNDKRWAILLPQSEVTTATAYAAGYTTTSTFTVPEVIANGYYDTPVGVMLTAGSTKGAFTINDSGDQVFFAPGNLQATYNGSTWSWDFAPEQWSYIGNAVGNTNVTSASPWISAAGTVDLFGWSTSDTYFGINSSTIMGFYSGVFVDWGDVANVASLDGYTNWRTLYAGPSDPSEVNEWDYIFNGRTTTSNVLYAKATVNGVKGVILLPDNWSTTYYNLNETNKHDALFSSNVINSTDWANCFETYGAVFLPAAGWRSGTSVGDVNTVGLYWSSYISNEGYPNCVYIYSSQIEPSMWLNGSTGLSVRLVRPL